MSRTPKFIVYVARSVDGFIARPDGFGQNALFREGVAGKKFP